MNKKCKTCGKNKDISCFAKYRYNGIEHRKASCRDCNKPSRKKYYTSHSDQIIEKNSAYKKNNRAQINLRYSLRKEIDVEFKLQESVRSIIKSSIKRQGGSKNRKSSIKYLPYTFPELKKHLEKQFEPWMTWQNWGIYDAVSWNDNDQSTWTWQLDHIIPKSCLPYSSLDEENFRKCWSLNNLRPLAAKQNIKDGPSRIRHHKAD